MEWRINYTGGLASIAITAHDKEFKKTSVMSIIKYNINTKGLAYMKYKFHQDCGVLF